MKKIDKLLISIENFKKELDSNKRIDRPYQFEDVGAILDSMQILAKQAKKETDSYHEELEVFTKKAYQKELEEAS